MKGILLGMCKMNPSHSSICADLYAFQYRLIRHIFVINEAKIKFRIFCDSKEKNIPFREAHKITGNIVRYCEKKKIKLSELTIKELKSFNKKINDDIFNVLDAEQSVNQKKSFGSTSPLMVKKSAAKWIKKLQNEKK